MNFKTDAQTGFPSEHIDPKQKRTKEWTMAYTKAAHEQSEKGLGSGLFFRSASLYKEWRKLARGEQDVAKYYPVLGIQTTPGGKKNKSWRGLDLSILPIGVKFKKILLGKILNERNVDVSIRAIDPGSYEEERQMKNQLKEQVINKEAIAEMQSMGVKQRPTINDGTPMPSTLSEVDDIVKLFRKDEYAIEVKDALRWYDSVNDRSQVDLETAEDIIETGVGIQRVDLDLNKGIVKYRRCIPERCISNYFMKTDGSDIHRFGEYIDMTIADLKKWWPGQPEEKYLEVAEKTGHNRFDHSLLDMTDISGYPWDKEKVTVLDHVWFSTDDEIYLVKPDDKGNNRLFRQDYRFPNHNRKPGEESITDEQYSERFPDRKIIRNPMRNVYKCKWIVGTDYCFDYGLATNMARTVTDYQDTKLPYIIHTTNFKSIIKLIESALDNIQLNWLQFQNHVAKSRPAGFSIEMSALENITLGSNKKRLQPKDVLRMFFDTGILVWRRKQYNAASNQFKPIEEFKETMSSAAERHLGFITAGINLIRDILGINEVEDASTPNPEILAGVAKMAATGTNNALVDIYRSFDSITVRRAKLCADFTPDVGRNSESFRNVLGARSQEFWTNLTLKEMGVEIDLGIDEKSAERIHEYAKISQQNGEITIDHLLEIENERNVMKKAQLLKQRRKEHMAEMQEIQRANEQSQNEINQNQIAASIQGEIQKITAKNQGELQVEQLRGQNELRVAQLELIKIKMQAGIDLSMEEQKLVGDIMKINTTKQWDMKIAKARPKPTASPKK